MPTSNWRDLAVCLDHDPELFDAPGRGRTSIEAIRICRGCPVRRDCLTFCIEEIDAAYDFGVWGGTSQDARREVREGRASIDDALAVGDRQAERLTARERLERDEPWLDPTTAVPVTIRNKRLGKALT